MLRKRQDVTDKIPLHVVPLRSIDRRPQRRSALDTFDAVVPRSCFSPMSVLSPERARVPHRPKVPLAQRLQEHKRLVEVLADTQPQGPLTERRQRGEELVPPLRLHDIAAHAEAPSTDFRPQSLVSRFSPRAPPYGDDSSYPPSLRTTTTSATMDVAAVVAPENSARLPPRRVTVLPHTPRGVVRLLNDHLRSAHTEYQRRRGERSSFGPRTTSPPQGDEAAIAALTPRPQVEGDIRADWASRVPSPLGKPITDALDEANVEDLLQQRVQPPPPKPPRVPTVTPPASGGRPRRRPLTVITGGAS